MKKYTYTEKKDTRSGFGDGLTELGQKNKNVVALCADLTGSLKMNEFKKNHPGRFFQVGIAEANMMGIAAGLTIGGKIPFTGTFANFSTGRVYDQIRQSIAYSGKNVKICASHAGITLGEDGATHQILEDIGMMKMLPGMTVINTCDYNQTKAATIAIADHKGPVYLRFVQDSTPIGNTADGTTFANMYANDQINSAYNLCQQSATFLFSPSDTNSHTYKVQSQGNNTNGYGINRWWANGGITATSNITLMEVAA